MGVASNRSPMDLRIPRLMIKLRLESNPPSARISILSLALCGENPEGGIIIKYVPWGERKPNTNNYSIYYNYYIYPIHYICYIYYRLYILLELFLCGENPGRACRARPVPPNVYIYIYTQISLSLYMYI